MTDRTWRGRMVCVVVAVGLTVGVLASPLRAEVVLQVDDDAPPAGDGLSWDTAFRFLQDALTFAGDPGNDVSEIRVAQGLYKPDRDEASPNGSGDREATFDFISDVALLGGFAGIGADDPNERDIEAFETILSGDLSGNDGRNFQNYAENSYHVATSANTTAVLDGVSITAGNANGANPNDDGAGFYVSGNDAPTITACCFRGNVAEDSGGGVYLAGAAAVLTNCTFQDNRADEGGGAFSASLGTFQQCVFGTNLALSSGGGLYFLSFNQTVVDCSFTANSANSGGGGMYIRDSGAVTISGSTFCANTAFAGAGLEVLFAGTPTVTNCRFEDNVASVQGHGGAIVNGTVTQSVIINCLFRGNSAGCGGAISNVIKIGGFPKVINCTFSDNIAATEGGAMDSNLSSPVVTNCVFWGDAPDEITGDTGVTYSNVMGGYAGTGNIDADPLFADPDNDDYHVLPGSPCIDAADNTVVPRDIHADLDGNPRFVDDSDTDDTGNGDPPIVDMGAYERPDTCPWDLNNDDLVGTTDLLLLLGMWGTDPRGPPDFDGDGNVGTSDLIELLGNWGPCS